MEDQDNGEKSSREEQEDEDAGRLCYLVINIKNCVSFNFRRKMMEKYSCLSVLSFN